MSTPTEPHDPSNRVAPDLPPPSPLYLLWLWLKIGAQSFGGGAATFYMIYQTFVMKNGWITPEAFTQMRAMVEIVPGMNILAVTILIGWRFYRGLGVFFALFGLLLPSVSITLLMTALYLGVQDRPLVQSAVRGVVPALVGVSMYTMWRTAQPVLLAGKRAGWASLGLSVAVLLGCGLALVIWPGFPAFGLYFVAGLIFVVQTKIQSNMKTGGKP